MIRTTDHRLLVETVRGQGESVLHTIIIVELETNFIIVLNVILYTKYKKIFLVYILLSELMSTHNDAMLKKYNNMFIVKDSLGEMLFNLIHACIRNTCNKL